MGHGAHWNGGLQGTLTQRHKHELCLNTVPCHAGPEHQGKRVAEQRAVWDHSAPLCEACAFVGFPESQYTR